MNSPRYDMSVRRQMSLQPRFFAFPSQVTMVMLTCAIVGEDGMILLVSIDSLKGLDQLKDAINEKLPSRLKCSSQDMTLFLAKWRGMWLKAVDVNQFVNANLSTYFQKMEEGWRILHYDSSFPVEAARVFGDIHVLVFIPKQMDANRSTTPHSQPRQRWAKINDIVDALYELEGAHQEKKGYSVAPRLTAIDNAFSKDHWKNIKSAWSISEKDFDLLSTVLTEIMMSFKLMESENDERCRYLIPPILRCLARGLPYVTILVENVDVLVDSQVHFEFVLVRGNKRTCTVAAKHEKFGQGSANAQFGWEIVADIENTHEVHDVVAQQKFGQGISNAKLGWEIVADTHKVRDVAEKWIHIKSLDKEIPYDDFHALTFNGDGVPDKEQLVNIVEKLHSMLTGN